MSLIIFKYRLRLALLVAVIAAMFALSGCCSRYSYYTYKRDGEQALKSRNYKKAQNRYSIIYNNEKKSENIDTERITWAFYRLGVIAELSGNLKLAKGYYWGDSIEDGFYSGNRLVGWYAKTGWKQIDEKNVSRTLSEILDFEKTQPPEENSVVERKKEVIIPKGKRSFKPYPKPDTTGVITKTYNRSRSLPGPGTPKPFQVFY